MRRTSNSAASAPVPDDIYLEAAEWLDVLADHPQDKITARRFQNWLQQDSRHPIVLERMAQTWGDQALTDATRRAKASLPLKQRYVAASPVHRRLRRRFAAFACSAVMAMLLLLPAQPWLQDGKPQNLTETLAIETPVAEVRTMQLADGSKLDINADSSLSVNLSDTRRLIDLKRGATYFAVAPDKQRPFTVTIDQASVIAVGTEFNIDKSRSGIDVTVHEGAIEVRATPESLPALVRAGEHVRIHNNQLSPIRQVALERVVDWRSGWIEIDDEPLAYLLEQVSRYSTKPIELKDAELAQLRVAGRFQLKNPEATLVLLRQFYALKTLEQKERILVYPTSS